MVLAPESPPSKQVASPEGDEAGAGPREASSADDSKLSQSSFVYFVGGEFGLPFGDSVHEDSEFIFDLALLAEAGINVMNHLDVTAYVLFGVGGLNKNPYEDRAREHGKEPDSGTPPYFLGVGPQVRWTLFRAGTIAPYIGAGAGLTLLTVDIGEKGDGTCQDDPSTSVDECATATVDGATYVGFTAGPVVGLRFARLGGKVASKHREEGGGGTSLFAQFALRYGLAWGGPDTFDGTSSGDLDLHHYEFALGLSGF